MFRNVELCTRDTLLGNTLLGRRRRDRAQRNRFRVLKYVSRTIFQII